MYDLISSIMNHTWIIQGAGEQQYIYYIAGTVILLTIVFLFDLVKLFVHVFSRKR